MSILLAASGASAQPALDGPRRFDVTDVAADDVLNIRSTPAATSPILGRYPANATAIEILELSPDGAWGLVGLPEGNGWVAMRFLQRVPHLTDDVPRPLRCHGTEPFWSFGIGDEGEGARFDTLDAGEARMTLIRDGMAENGLFALATQGVQTVTLFAQNGICYDGMSDRRFGLQATVLFEGPQLPLIYNGCCTTDANF